MFRKIITVVIVGLLLHPGYALARANAAPQPTLQEVQTQARAANRQLLQDLKKFPQLIDKHMGRQAELVLGSIVVFFATTFALCLYLEKSSLKPSSFLRLMKLENLKADLPIKAAPALEKTLTKPSITPSQTTADLIQFVTEPKLPVEYLEEYNFLRQELELALTDPAWTASQTANRFLKYDFKHNHYTVEEANYVAQYLKYLRENPSLLTTSSKELPTLFRHVEKFAPSSLNNRVILSRLLSLSTFTKIGIGGAGLFLIGSFLHTTHLEDAQWTQRLLKNPNLFLEASAAELEAISQNQTAAAFCRSYAEALSQLAALPLEKKNTLIKTFIKMNSQRRAYQEIIRSLRTVKAR